MGMSVGGKKGVMSEMNVVPLIDVLLVLLIIFMVITPLTPRGLDAKIPQQRDTPPPPPEQAAPETVVVQVGEGQLRINQQDITWESLGTRIEAIFKWRSQRVAFVEGEAEVQFLEVARAIDIMRTAGVESVGLLTPRMLPARER